MSDETTILEECAVQRWLNARSAKLLEQLNDTPFTDDADDIKLTLIRSAMREASIEMFHRAAETSRKKIDNINKEALADSIGNSDSSLFDDVLNETESLLSEANIENQSQSGSISESEQPASDSSALNAAFSHTKKDASAGTASKSAEGKPAAKIQISSSVIRRAD